MWDFVTPQESANVMDQRSVHVPPEPAVEHRPAYDVNSAHYNDVNFDHFVKVMSARICTVRFFAL